MSRKEPKRSPSPSPSFWFGFELSWLKLLLVRVTFFPLLAVDALLQIPHAARYGTGFQLAHLPLLDGLAPGRVPFIAIHLALAALFTLAALGVLTRLALPLAAALYAWVYLSSQLDSYQHHYLVGLVLVLACAVPWERPPATPLAATTRSWAARLILVQLAIVYAWAAIAKLSPAWLDGSALALQVRVPWVRSLVDAVPGTWATVAVVTVAVELFLAVAVPWRRLWPIAAPLAVAFHLGIDQTGLEIGLFSYLMVALWLLAVPERWLAPLARIAPVPGPRPPPGWSFAALLVAIAASAAVAAAVRLPTTTSAALAIGAAIAVAFAVLRRRPSHLAAAAPLVATLLWLAVDRGTDIAADTYRYWGGSARRLGNPAEARIAYQRLVAIAPDHAGGHYQLGRLLAADAPDRAREHLRRAQALEPRRARAFVAEGELLVRRGDRAAALDRARAAVAAEPADAAARRLLADLEGGAAPTGSPGGEAEAD
jgi:hypothetical protein